MTEFKAAHKGRDDVAAAAQRVIDAINHRGAGYACFCDDVFAYSTHNRFVIRT